MRWVFVQVQKTKGWTIALLLALWESLLSWQLTWFRVWLAKVCVRRRWDRVPASWQHTRGGVNAAEAFQRRVCWIWIIGPSQRRNAKSKPGIEWVDLATLPKGISVSSMRCLRCLHTRHQPLLSTTQWSMCVCLKNWHCDPWHLAVQHLKEDDANGRKSSDWAPQIGRKGE